MGLLVELVERLQVPCDFVKRNVIMITYNVSAPYFETLGLIFDGKDCHVWSKHCHTFIQMTGRTVIRRFFGGREDKNHMSRPMGKPTICIDENKDADQLRGNREADQRLCFRYSDSTIPPLLNSKISSF